MANRNRSLHKVTQELTSVAKKDYIRLKCKRSYKPQEITYVRACETECCKQDGIQLPTPIFWTGKTCISIIVYTMLSTIQRNFARLDGTIQINSDSKTIPQQSKRIITE